MSLNIDMNMTEFFVAGGTLRYDSPSYIRRPADEELFQAALRGEFCYVLTARQMGKSSLMVRTACRLQENGRQTAIIDLTRIGTGMKAEQWYLGLLMSLATQLNLQTNPRTWWQAHENLGPVQRFVNFLHEIVLVEAKQRVVIFIDEIDTTLNLDFSDDFFASIRSLYNARASDPSYQRLTFVLLGVAIPADLIKDRRRTPFNIGFPIDLRDFQRKDAQVLQEGLERIYPTHGKQIFDRIFYWTRGHPYLTQKLCAIVASRPGRWTTKQVDLLVNRIFFSEDSQREANVQFIRRSIAASPQRRDLLNLYQKIYEDKSIVEDERSREQNELKLFGLVVAENGNLQIRNPIYQQVFNGTWIKENTPVDWTHRVLIWAIILALVLVGTIRFNAWWQAKQADEKKAATLVGSFNETQNGLQRLGNLEGLFALRQTKFNNEAFRLFNGLTPDEKSAIFESTREVNLADDKDLQAQIVTVIQGIYVYPLDNTPENNELLQAMLDALESINEANSTLAREIKDWKSGRTATTQSESTCVTEYAKAFVLQNNNPAFRFDRALCWLALEDYDSSLSELDRAIELSQSLGIDDIWLETVSVSLFKDNEQLVEHLSAHVSNYPHLKVLVE